VGAEGVHIIRYAYTKRRPRMANKKTIFIAFAIEDEKIRNMIKGQSLNTNSSFEYVDMSVKEAVNGHLF
jgi:hypothetical protein